jgi:hypothetical protein
MKEFHSYYREYVEAQCEIERLNTLITVHLT